MVFRQDGESFAGDRAWLLFSSKRLPEQFISVSCANNQQGDQVILKCNAEKHIIWDHLSEVSWEQPASLQKQKARSYVHHLALLRWL